MKVMQYEEAIIQLEEIAHKMENGEFGIDEMPTQIKKAQQLIKLCKDKLKKTDAEITKLLDKDTKSKPSALIAI